MSSVLFSVNKVGAECFSLPRVALDKLVSANRRISALSVPFQLVWQKEQLLKLCWTNCATQCFCLRTKVSGVSDRTVTHTGTLYFVLLDLEGAYTTV